MKPCKVRLQCEACELGFFVSYDTEVPTKLLAIHCKCGHTTPIKSVTVLGCQAMTSNDVKDGDVVDVRLSGDELWHTGKVIKARKMWVQLDGSIADENNIVEWRPALDCEKSKL